MIGYIISAALLAGGIYGLYKLMQLQSRGFCQDLEELHDSGLDAQHEGPIPQYYHEREQPKNPDEALFG